MPEDIAANEPINLFELLLERKSGCYKGMLGITDIKHNVLEKETHALFGEEEFLHFRSITNNRTKEDYLRSRYISKITMAYFTHTQFLKSIRIRHGVFNQPLVEGSNQISIAHNGNYAACLVFPDEHPMGLDIEMIQDNAVEKIGSQLTAEEVKMAQKLSEEENISYTRYWTVKEALSKVLKTGLMIPFQMLEIDAIEPQNQYTTCYFKHFTQYKSISYMLNGMILSIVLPAETTLKTPRPISILESKT